MAFKVSLDHVSSSSSWYCLLSSTHHHLVDKVDDCSSRLIRVQLCEHVALVAGSVGGFPRNKGKQFVRDWRLLLITGLDTPPPVFWIHTTVTDLTRAVVLPEEQLPGLISQGDTLS